MLSDWSLERAGRVNKEEEALKLEAAALKSLQEAQETQDSTNNDSGSVSRSNSFSATVSPTKARSDSHNGSDNAYKIRSARNAALVIIGDEILNGFTIDSNLQVTSKALAAIGIPLKMVSMVSDDIEEIAMEVSRLSAKFDIVITSGGIGPTHDDVTLKAVAKALGQNIVLNTEMLGHLESNQAMETKNRQILQCEAPKGEGENEVDGNDNGKPVLDESMLKLAMLPHLSRLRFPPAPDDYITMTKKDIRSQPQTLQIKAWPILQCSNIFVLPGVPQFFANKMHLIVKHFLPKYPVQEKRSIVLGIEERTLVTHLDRLVEKFPHVKIGSYPYEDHLDVKTIIRIEGKNAQLVDDAVAGLLEELPTNAVLRVEKGEKYDPAV
jgi:FAD synthetase